MSDRDLPPGAVITAIADVGEGTAAVSIVEALIALRDLGALITGIDERVYDARERGATDRGWFAQLKDQRDELERRRAAVNRDLGEGLASWRETYRPQARH